MTRSSTSGRDRRYRADQGPTGEGDHGRSARGDAGCRLPGQGGRGGRGTPGARTRPGRGGARGRATAASAARTSTSCSRGGATRPGHIAGHEFTGTIAAVGEGVEGWQVGEVGGRRPVPQVRPLPALPRGQAVAVREPDGRRPATFSDGAFARYILSAGRVAAAGARGCEAPRRGAGRAPGRGPPRHHPLGGEAR